jgi:hypothetical protein
MKLPFLKNCKGFLPERPSFPKWDGLKFFKTHVTKKRTSPKARPFALRIMCAAALSS